MKNKVFYLKIIIVILAILNGVTFSRLTSQKCEVNTCFHESKQDYILIEKNIINKSFRSFLYKNSQDDFIGEIYNYETEEPITIEDLIKEDKITLYQEKIKELLYLKYPKFIVEALLQGNTKYSYLLRDNELVIYFNNYVIEPEIDEVLYLKVNYEVIKDYLNFNIVPSGDVKLEDGYNYTKAKKSVAITFDDSPNKGKTDKILEYLKDNKAHATFFVVGNKIASNKNLLISMKNNGNEIGSHSYSHKLLTKVKDDEYLNDYNKVNDLYKNLFQEDLKLFRPPYGAVSKSQQTMLPTSYILWSIDTNDWRYRNSDYLVNYVLDNIKDGDIILFHDAYDSTVLAISKLLPLLYSKGYQVMSVSELAKLKGYTLEEHQVYHKFN